MKNWQNILLPFYGVWISLSHRASIVFWWILVHPRQFLFLNTHSQCLGYHKIVPSVSTRPKALYYLVLLDIYWTHKYYISELRKIDQLTFRAALPFCPFRWNNSLTGLNFSEQIQPVCGWEGSITIKTPILVFSYPTEISSSSCSTIRPRKIMSNRGLLALSWSHFFYI